MIISPGGIVIGGERQEQSWSPGDVWLSVHPYLFRVGITRIPLGWKQAPQRHIPLKGHFGILDAKNTLGAQ